MMKYQKKNKKRVQKMSHWLISATCMNLSHEAEHLPAWELDYFLRRCDNLIKHRCSHCNLKLSCTFFIISRYSLITFSILQIVYKKENKDKEKGNEITSSCYFVLVDSCISNLLVKWNQKLQFEPNFFLAFKVSILLTHFHFISFHFISLNKLMAHSVASFMIIVTKSLWTLNGMALFSFSLLGKGQTSVGKVPMIIDRYMYILRKLLPALWALI